MSVVDEVKERADIVEIVGESVNLRKAGKNYTGFCPFHANTRTPAFVVFPDTGTWRCFGACNEGGDVFTYLMKKEGYEFAEALRLLAERTGVELRPRTPEDEALQEEYEQQRQLLETAVTYFRHQLLHSPAGEQVQAYLTERQLAGESIERFELGYAPNSWDALLTFFQEKGTPGEQLVEVGLVSERDTGGYFDRFRHRLMIPIRDARGRMTGFGARALDPEDEPKYLNSPQTPLFDKGSLLYGLDKARKAIRLEDQAVIVEGYMDVIGLHQAGYENAVSPMGTALSEPQLRQLKRYSRRMVLALDADAAGDQATLRGLDVARDALDRSPDPVFAARGLVRHEGRLDAELRIVTLPEGRDPDEVVAADPAAWPALLAGAQPVVDYVLDILCAGRDLEDAKNKADIARQVLPLIEDVADRVEREAYRQKLARRLKIDERALLSYSPAQASRRRATRPSGEERAEAAPVRRADTDKLERRCLGILLQFPDLLYRLDREMQGLELERLSEHDFSGADRRLLFQAVRKALGQHDLEPIEHWQGSLEPPLNDLAQELLGFLPVLTFDQPKDLAEALSWFLQLRKNQLGQQLTQIHFQMISAQEAQSGGQASLETDLRELVEQTNLLRRNRDKLDRALAARGPARASLAPGSW
jgi:DNA primase